jgi:hypothetical protein
MITHLDEHLTDDLKSHACHTHRFDEDIRGRGRGRSRRMVYGAIQIKGGARGSVDSYGPGTNKVLHLQRLFLRTKGVQYNDYVIRVSSRF